MFKRQGKPYYVQRSLSVAISVPDSVMSFHIYGHQEETMGCYLTVEYADVPD
jgi:hypothetical protein